MKCVRAVSGIFFGGVGTYRFLSTICWKDHPFLVELTLLFCQNNQFTILALVCLWDFCYVPLIYLFILLLISHCLDYTIFIENFEIRWLLSSYFVHFSILCWVFWVFAFPFKLESQFVDIHIITCWTFSWDSIKSIY